MKALKEFIKNRLTFGLWSSFKDLYRELNIFCLHRYSVIKASRYHGTGDYKLNLGCGTNRKQGWVNIDLTRGADLRLDLREPIPFRNNSCSIIYCEHFLEHLDYPEIINSFLREIHRILRPGGVFSMGVPDTEWPLKAYLDMDDSDYFEFVDKNWHAPWCRTRMEHINYHFSQEGLHKFAYDFETVEILLQDSGFTEIKRRDFCAETDSPERKTGTLYVKALKSVLNDKMTS